MRTLFLLALFGVFFLGADTVCQADQKGFPAANCSDLRWIETTVIEQLRSGRQANGL